MLQPAAVIKLSDALRIAKDPSASEGERKHIVAFLESLTLLIHVKVLLPFLVVDLSFLPLPKAGNYCWYRIYRPIPPNTAQYRPIPPNTAQYRPIPPNTAQYRPIPPNTAKYRQIPPNTAKYRQILRIWRYLAVDYHQFGDNIV